MPALWPPHPATSTTTASEKAARRTPSARLAARAPARIAPAAGDDRLTATSWTEGRGLSRRGSYRLWRWRLTAGCCGGGSVDPADEGDTGRDDPQQGEQEDRR